MNKLRTVGRSSELQAVAAVAVVGFLVAVGVIPEEHKETAISAVFGLIGYTLLRIGGKVAKAKIKEGP